MVTVRSWVAIVALVACFSVQWQHVLGKKVATCQQVCENLGVSDGCKYASNKAPEEVIVVTNGSSDIKSWKWDTITMVVSAYFSSVRSTSLTACYAHSMGRRYGLKEAVPSDVPRLISDTDNVKSEFSNNILIYQKLLMADHIVYDFLAFFTNLDSSNPSVNKTVAISKISEVVLHTIQRVRTSHDSEVYCIVPWQPPCKSDCRDVKALLSNCDVLLLSPDSYNPVASADQNCMAQATVPVSQFLYGIDRYLSLKARPTGASSIVAGIPWHGYLYTCDQLTSQGDKCVINKNAGEACFNRDNRQRMSLTEIHMSNIPQAKVKMDVVTKGIYYNWNDSAQLWFENFTTLLIKYQLVQDLQLKGLSLWYGEDLSLGMSVDKDKFYMQSWSFLTHHVLHSAVFNPSTISHYYADTVAGIAVGCLLLGTILGVTFTCIGFRHSNFNRLNRPFKLDEDEGGYRDDEGL